MTRSQLSSISRDCYRLRMLTPTSYRILTRVGLPLVIGAFMLRSINQRAYRQRLAERLGVLPPMRTGSIVIHAASVGEVIALKPFIRGALERFPDLPITVTTFTPTGSEQVGKLFGDSVQHCYLPIDSPGCVKRFLRAIQPRALVVMETEIWPNLLQQCHVSGVKLCLINGRISSRSLPRYQKLRSLIAPTLAVLEQILSQSQADRERFIALGSDPGRTHCAGNIKYDLTAPENINQQINNLRSTLTERKVWVVGSTHEDEEAIVIAAYQQLLKQMPTLLLIWAPRHPERVNAIATQLGGEGFTWVKRSAALAPSHEHQIWLIDTMGELLLFYALADVCTVAGSFGQTGGHNPLEPALFAQPINVGPMMGHFEDILTQLTARDAIVSLPSCEALALATSVETLLSNPVHAKAMGTRALEVLRENQGATASSLKMLEDLLSS